VTRWNAQSGTPPRSRTQNSTRHGRDYGSPCRPAVGGNRRLARYEGPVVFLVSVGLGWLLAAVVAALMIGRAIRLADGKDLRTRLNIPDFVPLELLEPPLR
jgi:hypothetical protein